MKKLLLSLAFLLLVAGFSQLQSRYGCYKIIPKMSESLGDPAPNEKKVLTINSNDSWYVYEEQDNVKVNIPCEIEGTVNRALYSKPGLANVVDVTERLKQMPTWDSNLNVITPATCFKKISKMNTIFGNPNPDKKKKLTLQLAPGEFVLPSVKFKNFEYEEQDKIYIQVPCKDKEIMKATYGTKDKNIDVTEKLKSLQLWRTTFNDPADPGYTLVGGIPVD